MEDKREVVMNSSAAVKEVLPDTEQVRLIFKDTYNFYTKWTAVKEPDWSEVMAEVYSLEVKYPFELCRKILVEIVAIIEANYMTKEDG